MSVAATGTAEGADEPSLARDMLDVRGPKAAAVARDNARSAALAGRRSQAKFWIRVLGLFSSVEPIRTNDPKNQAIGPLQVQLKDNGNVYFPGE